jgi:hydroxyacylglutathione hydrolase
LRDADEVHGTATIVDVRQRPEWTDGHLPGAVHVELGALPAHAAELRGRQLTVHCGHGERAMTAASLLARHGQRDVVTVVGGPGELAAALGTSLERGP